MDALPNIKERLARNGGECKGVASVDRNPLASCASGTVVTEIDAGRTDPLLVAIVVGRI